MLIVGCCVWHLLATHNWSKNIFLDNDLESLCNFFVIINAKSLVYGLAFCEDVARLTIPTFDYKMHCHFATQCSAVFQ